MKTFRYRQDINTLKLNDTEKEFFAKDGQKSVFENILNQALSTKYPQGIPAKTGRILARIYTKLDATEVDTLELEEAEFELVRDALTGEEARFAPQQFRLLSLYAAAIEAAAKDSK